MDLDIASIAARPDRADLWPQLQGLWPRFMTQDPSGDFFYGYEATTYPEFALLAVDALTGLPVAKALSVPLFHDGEIADGLPEGGWAWAIRQSASPPTIVCAAAHRPSSPHWRS